jgi:hypothetical protein
VCMLLPFVAITIMLSIKPEWAFILPFFCIKQCQIQTSYNYDKYINDTMKAQIFSFMTINVLFYLCLFMIRKVSPMFSASREIRQVVILLSLMNTISLACLLYSDQSIFVVLGYFLYIPITASIICLYLTSLRPIAQTYETSRIIPFSLNSECLNNFESAII